MTRAALDEDIAAGIAVWLIRTDPDTNLRCLATDVASWSDFDWSTVANELDIPIPASARRQVIDLLTAWDAP